MDTIWVGISPRSDVTRVLATHGPEETILKARLRATPQHPRALSTLLEALALWQGTKVRAALSVDDQGGCSATRLWPELEDDRTPLFSLDVVSVRRPRRRRDGLDGMGDFRDLRQLLLFEVAR